MIGKLSLLSAVLKGFRDRFDPAEISKALSTMHRFHDHEKSGITKLFIPISHSEPGPRWEGAIRLVKLANAQVGRHGR